MVSDRMVEAADAAYFGGDDYGLRTTKKDMRRALEAAEAVQQESGEPVSVIVARPSDLPEKDWRGWDLCAQAYIIAQREASRALHPAPAGESEMKVKALEWARPVGVNVLLRADTIIGIYRVWTHHEADGKWFWALVGGVDGANGTIGSESDGVAAAQADYEARIRSALETRP